MTLLPVQFDQLAELAPGHRIGAYEIRSLLGRGGMGEVYRAYDARLRRDVALKLLPAAVAENPDRLERFEHEARALAALSHPNIAAIYGVEDRALVLELVEGETLAERLQRGAIPPDDAIAIARQIADGLEAAHDAGIIHRDLKPANVKITPAGLVKLLDFGIAKTSVAHDDETRAATEEGVVIGTTAYMSPEQARGQQVDKRTDIWAFGCVLFELLTRKYAFARATQTDTLAAIIEHEPDWSAVPASTPPDVAALLRRCLIKNTRQRLRDIGEARITLSATDGSSALPAGRRLPVGLAAAVATLVIAAGAAVYWLWPKAIAPAATISFPVNPPPATFFRPEVMRVFFDLSPDGSRIAFMAGEGGTSQIWVQVLGELQARQLAGTDRGGSPAWSPDGQSLAFFQDNQLKRVDLQSGVVAAICDVRDFARQSASWGRDGQIVFASGEAGAIWLVPAAGGTPEVVVKRDEAAGQTRVHFPMFLPDGRRFLYAIKMADGSSRLAIAAKGTAPREVGSIESNMRWIDPYYLVSARRGALIAQRFDLDREQLVGEPVVVTERVHHFPTTARALFSASASGTVVYHNGTDQSQLTWFDRSGRITGTVSDVTGHETVRISPDGNRVVFDRTGETPGFDLWMADLDRNVETRLTSDPGAEVTPVWLPDGRGIVYGSDRGGGSPVMFRRDLDTGVDTALRPGVRQQQSIGLSRDGQTLGFVERGPGGNFELFLMPMARPQEAAPVFPRARDSYMGSWFSPDGRALTFSSSRSGRAEVYVAPLANPAGAITVSPRGGYSPRWSPNGRELTYLSPDQRLMSVPITTSTSIVVGAAEPLFDLPTGEWLDYDTGPDGRFLAIVMKQPANEQPIITIVNWRPPGS